MNCHQINQVIDLAIKEGNEIFYEPKNRGEDEKLVVWMTDPLTPSVKGAVDAAHLNLKYWQFEGAPHNPEACGYTCEECNIVLAFPDKKTPRL